MQFDWLKAQSNQPMPAVEGGASGYFSQPEDTLDPHLFNGRRLNSNVNNTIKGRLIAFLRRDMKLNDPEKWIHVYLAGSGITYQWSANRGNGDLDVLLGLDRTSFNSANPEYASIGEDDLANLLDTALRQKLWPTMASTTFNGKSYEVTFFYNPGTRDDIRNINPYAAYDLTKDSWVVEPPKETAATHTFPKSWHEDAANDQLYALHLISRYGKAYGDLKSSAQHSGSYLNASSQLNVVAAESRALLDSIHLGRRTAFQGGGQGYLDKANFRWQMAKQNGVIKGLSEVAGVRARAIEEAEEKLYGSKLPSVEDLKLRAMLHRRNG
jgi:hypothetical protein